MAAAGHSRVTKARRGIKALVPLKQFNLRKIPNNHSTPSEKGGELSLL